MKKVQKTVYSTGDGDRTVLTIDADNDAYVNVGGITQTEGRDLISALRDWCGQSTHTVVDTTTIRKIANNSSHLRTLALELNLRLHNGNREYFVDEQGNLDFHTRVPCTSDSSSSSTEGVV